MYTVVSVASAAAAGASAHHLARVDDTQSDAADEGVSAALRDWQASRQAQMFRGPGRGE